MSDKDVSPSLIRRADATGVPLAIARLAIGCYFIYTGIIKLEDPVLFLKQIKQYEMLPLDPAYFLNGTAVILPWLELICGAALVLGVFVRGAGAMIAVMLAVFTPAIFLRAWAIHKTEGTDFMKIAFDCGCGTGEIIIWKKLILNSLTFLVTLIPVFSNSRRWCLAGRSRSAPAESEPASVAEPTS